MSRPRRGTEAVFYDTFADWTAEDQAAALKVLKALHRQTIRASDSVARRAADAKPLPESLQRGAYGQLDETRCKHDKSFLARCEECGR